MTAPLLSDEQIDETPTPRTDEFYFPFGIDNTAMYGRHAMSAVTFARTLERELAEEIELHRMQLTAIDVLSLLNTRESLAKQTLPKDNPYWTPAWESVARAIGREIEEREALAAANAALRDAPPIYVDHVSKTLSEYETWRRKHAAAIERARKG